MLKMGAEMPLYTLHSNTAYQVIQGIYIKGRAGRDCVHFTETNFDCSGTGLRLINKSKLPCPRKFKFDFILIKIVSIKNFKIQDHPKRMKLQRQLYVIYTCTPP